MLLQLGNFANRSFGERHFYSPIASLIGFHSSTTTYKVIVSNVHNEAQREDIEPLVTPLGDVQAIDLTNSGTGEDHQTFTLTYHTKEEADKAVKELHETEFKGQTLQARLSERRSPRRMAGSGPSHLQRNIDFPLRILVQSDMVGAIIGRGGQTIRQITQQTRYIQIFLFFLTIINIFGAVFSEQESTYTEKTVWARQKRPSPFTASRRIVVMLVYKSSR